MARILLTYPSRKVYGDGCLECGCPLLINGIKTLAYPHNILPYGFDGQGTCQVEGKKYTYSFDLVIAGEQISGSIKFTNTRGKSITSILNPQTTAYPSLPYYNEWSNIKIPGYGSNAVISIKDSHEIAKLQNNQKQLTNDLSATFNFTAINISNNTVVAADSVTIKPFNCTDTACVPYSDNTWLWQEPKTTIDINISTLKNLPSTPVSIDATGGVRTYINMRLNSMIIDESVGSLLLSIALASVNQLQDASTIKRYVQGESSYISVDNLFKSSTTWSEVITIIDTLNPLTGIIKNPSSILPSYNPDLQLVLSITLNGQYDINKLLRS